MSQENVELVRQLQAPPGVDLVQLFTDEQTWSAFAETASAFVHPDCEFVAPGVPSRERAYSGLDGLKGAWLEWLAPWATYRVEFEEAIDLGESVLVLPRDFGRLADSTQEVKTSGGAIWTVRDGKIARVEFYLNRSEAFKAVGLED